MVGKPNQKIPRAPLQPIPAFEEPFSIVLIECVGPLPKSKSGNEYLLTIMCTSTRFPEGKNYLQKEVFLCKVSKDLGQNVQKPI